MTPFAQTGRDLLGQTSTAEGARVGLSRAKVAPPSGMRIQLAPLPRETKADDCCSALLAIHAAAIQHNLGCVLTSVDPEGPHQLRVALRRLRVVLRTFRPVMRAARAEPITAAARRLGAIVSELRDADVLIDEMIRPSATADAINALNDWRNEVRGRVRARLVSAGAGAFAADLAELSGHFGWRKRSAQAKGRLAAELVASFVARGGRRVARVIARLPQLSSEQVHDVRKEVKVLRYSVELADALSLNGDRDLAHCLKRAQDALGYANDVATLQRFSPPLICEGFSRLRDHLVSTRTDAVSENIASAVGRLRNIEARCGALDWRGA